MFVLLEYAFIFSALFTTVFSGILTTGCNQGTEGQDIKNALDDVQTVSKAVLAALVSGKINNKEDLFQAAYEPLFAPQDKPALISLFTQLSTVQSNSLFIMIYCTEQHIQRLKNANPQNWYDTGYVSRTNGKTMPIAASKGANKPGSKGSYTTLGYKDPNNDQWDTSNTAHIFIHPARLHPPAGTKRDLRPYPTIVKDGLKDYFRIEDIKPLAQTVLHELTHAVGGLQSPAQDQGKPVYRLNVGDGPSGNTYGWINCNVRRDMGLSNANIADCITYLAQAIYLSQIQGKDAYWTTGEVDERTLRPAYLAAS